MNTQLQAVKFNDQTPLTIEQDNVHYVAMRPICENIGLAWGSQFERINRDDVLKSTVLVIRTVAEDGKSRQMLCLPIQYLNGWLFGIDVKRVKPEIRETLITYKRECYQALFDYWNKGKAEKTQTTVDDRTGLRNAVNMLVSKKGLIYSDAYNIIHQYMNVESIEDIAKEDLPKAVAYCHKIILEGELIDKPTALLPKNNFRTSWNDDELRNLASFWCATYEMHDMLKRLEPILRQLDSSFHPIVFSQVRQYPRVMELIHRRLQIDIDHLQYADPHDRHWQYCLNTINSFNKPKVKRVNF